jgi:hypothetical protein
MKTMKPAIPLISLLPLSWRLRTNVRENLRVVGIRENLRVAYVTYRNLTWVLVPPPLKLMTVSVQFPGLKTRVLR